MTQPNSLRYNASRAARFFTVTLVLATGALPVSAATDAEDLAIYKNELIGDYAATSFKDLKRVHHEVTPYVYGNSDFLDIKGLHFRCKIHHGKVRVLVKGPEFVNGRSLAKNRPHGPQHEGLELDAAATALPPVDHPSPHFVLVP